MNKKVKLTRNKNGDIIGVEINEGISEKDLINFYIQPEIDKQLKAEHKEMIELVKKRISDEITYQVKIGSKQASYKISVLYKIIKSLK